MQNYIPCIKRAECLLNRAVDRACNTKNPVSKFSFRALGLLNATHGILTRLYKHDTAKRAAPINLRLNICRAFAFDNHFSTTEKGDMNCLRLVQDN